MVAYSFKPSFVADIKAKVKRQTIRLPRKRHARAGEGLQLFTGPRMKPVRLGGGTCIAAYNVRLDFAALSPSVTLDDGIVYDTHEALDAFAVRDGFSPPERFAADGLAPWEYMARWWRLTHPDHRVFNGVLIDWDDSFRAVS